VVLLRDATTHGVGGIVIISNLQTLPSPLNTAIGCMVSSVMKLLALVTGPAGTELPLNSSVLVDFSITKKLMLVIGHPMLQAARSTLSVLKILMPMYHLVPLVKDTGPAREDTPVSSVAQPLLFSTNSLADVFPHLQLIVKSRQPQNRLLLKKIKINSVVDKDKDKETVVETVLPSLAPNPSKGKDAHSHRESPSNLSILHLNLPQTVPSSQQEPSLFSSMSLSLRALRATSDHKDNNSKTLGLPQLPVPSPLTNCSILGIEYFFYYPSFLHVGKSCPHPKILSVILYPILAGILMIFS